MDTQPQWTQPGPGEPPGWPPPPDWPPPRRRSRVRLVAGILLVLVLFVAVAGLSGLRLWPSFPVPFASRQVDRSQPVLLKAIEDLAVYKAASGQFQVVVDLEESSRGIPLLIKGQRTLFVAGGSVDAEVDFSNLKGEAIRVSPDGTRVDITLPHARLTPARVDPEQSRVFSRERGLLDRLGSVLSDNPTSERELYRLAAAKMQAAAAGSDLQLRAEQNTRAMLQSMLRSLGYREVTVTFRDPPT
jgi:Protein of unknown function (DUF4230)